MPHACWAERVEHDDEMPLGGLGATELGYLVRALLGSEEITKPLVNLGAVPSPSTVGAGLHQDHALGAGFGLHPVGRLDPKCSEAGDEGIAKVTHVRGPPSTAGFQVGQQPAQLVGLDGADPGVGGEPDDPQGIGVGKRDR